MNVYAPFLARARESPEARAVLTAHGEISYGELERAVSWTASTFRHAGIAPGDHVAILLKPQLQYLVTSLALARIGAGQLALRADDPPRLRRDLYNRSRCAATVATKGAAVKGPRLEPPPETLSDLKDLAAGATDCASDGALPFLIKRSSGTTQTLAKMGILTHDMGVPSASEFPRELPQGAACRFMHFSHLAFATAMNNVPRVLGTGACLALSEGMADTGSLVEFISRHRVNFLAGGPIHASLLLAIAKPGSLLLPGIAALRLSSTLIHDELRREVLRKLTPKLYITYNMSETGALTIAGPEMLQRVPGTVGRPLRGVEIEILDAEGRVQAPGTPGRLRARTPWMMKGYLDDPQETARVFRDGWFHSGDLAECTPEGGVIHYGRADDLMIFNGVNISPAEIERVLLQHPAVEEAAAFGIESKAHGMIPVAAVVSRSKFDGHALLEHCRSWLGARSPTHLLEVKALPRNAAGKVLKRELVELFIAADRRRSSRRT